MQTSYQLVFGCLQIICFPNARRRSSRVRNFNDLTSA